MTEGLNSNFEERLAKAAALVEEWQANVQRVMDQVGDVRRILADCEKRRAELALGAATGEAKAVAAMRKVHVDMDVAQRKLTDLDLALGPARRKLAEAEHGLNVIRRETIVIRKAELARGRVEIAKKVDAAFKEAQALVDQYYLAGDEALTVHNEERGLRGMEIIPTGQAQVLMGQGRILGALPQFVRKYLADALHVPFKPLEVAEAEFFGLSIDQDAA